MPEEVGQPPSDERLAQILFRLRQFREERGWESVHTLKNLAAAIAVETSELQEIFLWRPEGDERKIRAEQLGELRDEIADILILCLNFADVAGIDVLDAVEEKISKNEFRYPIR